MIDTYFKIESLSDIIAIVLRQRWILVISFLIAMVMGIYLAITLPKQYISTTLIMVQPQSVPSGYVRSVVSDRNIENRLKSIIEQILSRTSIERIISEFSYFSEPKYEKMFLEDKVDNLRRRVNVRLSAGDTFSVSFKGTEPERVKDVTNALAAYFIEENIKVRQSQALDTSQFLEDELRVMEERLKKREEALREYRQRYRGSLPEQMEANLKMIDRIQEQVFQAQKSLTAARIQLIEVEKQISEQKPLPARRAPSGTVATTEDSAPDPIAELNKMTQKVAELRARYTDAHPDVVLAQQELERLKRRVASLPPRQTPTAGGSAGAGGATDDPRLRYQRLQQEQRDQLRLKITNLNNEIVMLNRQLKVYERRIEDTPKRDEELVSIKRDYENLQKLYNDLLSRKLEAEISANMEKKKKGEQFNVIDRAKLPEKPTEPNMNLLFLMIVALGTGFGAAAALVFEILDTSFHRPEEFEKAVHISVMATIPVIKHPPDLRREMRLKVLFWMSAAAAVGSFLLFALLTFKGVDETLQLVARVF